MKAKPYFFSYPSGVSSITELDSDDDRYGLAFETKMPKVGLRVQGSSWYDDDGVVSFGLEVAREHGTIIYSGHRKDGGLKVEFHGVGVRGGVFFEAGHYDLTTLDLLAIQDEDGEGLEDGTELWVLDPIRCDVYRATAKSVIENRDGTDVRRISLDFDGEVHEIAFARDSGEPIGGRTLYASAEGDNAADSGGWEVTWDAVSPEAASTHLRSLVAS